MDCPKNIKAYLEIGLFSYATKNLIQNAIQYSDSNTTINITAAEKTDGIEISIVDQGLGIESVHINRLFERFYRVDKDRSRKHGGTGLGLALVKHIIRIHNGRIKVKSKPGKGSQFIIILPKVN